MNCIFGCLLLYHSLSALLARAEIHQPLLSHFSLLVEFLIGKVPVCNKGSRVLKLANLTLDDFFNIQVKADLNLSCSFAFENNS